jgi:hypothetical protein
MIESEDRPMDRAELERLDRTTLIARAEGLGVTRANILTRPELMDELLVRSARKDDRDLPRARGFFGRARDLVARVIEKGLHLPDAAERLRQVSVTASQIAARVAPAAVPTVTLAEIYAAQGHRPRAIETLKRVLDIEPDHGAAKALLTKLETAPPSIRPNPPPPPEDENEELAFVAPPTAPVITDVTTRARSAPDMGRANGVSAPRERGEPLGFLDDEPLPSRYDVDECVAIVVDPVTLYVYWEVRDATFEHIKRTRADGSLTLRLLIITPGWDGPSSATRDFDVQGSSADRVIRDLPAGAVVRAAIGWRTGDAFLPIAHAPALETPPGAPCPVVAESFVRWTPRGLARVTPHDSDYASIGRALGKLAPRNADVPGYARTSPALGSSDVSAGFSPTSAHTVGAGSSEATP